MFNRAVRLRIVDILVCSKEWLIEHEADEPVFYIGRLIKMGIEIHKDDSRFIYVSPAQEFKMEFAKMDGGKGGTEQ